MKRQYIPPTLTIIAIEPSSLMAASGRIYNQAFMDGADGEGASLNDYGHTGKIDGARSKSNFTDVWE